MLISECGAEQCQKLTAKHPAEHSNRKEEAFPGSDPASAIEGDAAGRYEAMQMWMIKKLLVPCMQHRQKPDVGSEPAGIGGDGEQRLGNGLKKQVVNHLR